jgi:hypothetical protein
MRTYHYTAFTDLDIYDILYAGHKSDAFVGSGRRRRFLDLYGFHLSTSVWNVFVIEVGDSVVFGSTDGYGIWNNWMSLGSFSLCIGYVMLC